MTIKLPCNNLVAAEELAAKINDSCTTLNAIVQVDSSGLAGRKYFVIIQEIV